jgi:ParB-like chromosome segregation protein Spo0J
MNNPQKAKLKFLHPKTSLSPVKLDAFRRLSTEKLKASLHVGLAHSLKARPDGTLLDGHHRLTILSERGVDVHALPREIIEKKS